jgi:hypothetical protein
MGGNLTILFMSNPIDKYMSDLGINEKDLTSSQAHWFLRLAYNDLRDNCEKEGIVLQIDEQEFVAEYSLEHPVADYDSMFCYVSNIFTAIYASKHEPEHALGYVIPPAIPGVISGGASIASQFLRSQRFSNLSSDLMSSLGDQAKSLARAKLDDVIAKMEGGILGGKPNTPGGPKPPGSGGGGRGSTFGGTGSTQPIGSNFANHVHPTAKLDYNMGMESTLRGTEPFDRQQVISSGVISSSLTLKQMGWALPINDDMFYSYFVQIWTPTIRDALQGEKRLNSNLASLLSPVRLKQYIETVALSLQTYHFFTNLFNYSLLETGANTNSGLRYIREEMFTTTNLQKMSLLRERLDSLPWPQTLDSEIAYNGLIYTQSDGPFSGYRMNVPPIFEENINPIATSTNNVVNVITSIRPNVIQEQIDALDFIVSPDRENMLKMIGAICNTTNFQNSRVGSFQLEPYTDEVYNTQFTNSGVYMRGTVSSSDASKFEPFSVIYPVQADNDSEAVPYYSYSRDVPGMLQATWSPLDPTGQHWLGYWYPVTSQTTYRLNAQTTGVGPLVTALSNVFFYVEDIPNNALIGHSGDVATKGGFAMVHPNTQSCWLSNNFVVNPIIVDEVAQHNKYSSGSFYQKPYGSELITNMSLTNNKIQRLNYFKQIMETDAWSAGRSDNKAMGTAEKPRRRKRYGKDATMDTEEKES